MGTQEERQRKDNLVGRIGREEILEEGDSKAKYHSTHTNEKKMHMMSLTYRVCDP
jgi:hypothetical protein